MKIRQILHAAVFFLLPGMTAGWLLAAGALRFFDDPAVTGVIFAGAALAGALTGRYLSARKLLAGAGLLCLLALPVFRMHGLFPAVSFALGVFAIQPVRPVHRRFFQVGVWLTVSLGLLAGGAYLVNMYLAKIALSLLLPAISTLGAGKTFRRVTGTLFFLAGLILLLLPWTTPAAITLPRGETAAFWQSGDSAMLRLGNRIYRLPEDMDRQKPDLLIAALQVQTGNPCALVIAEAPGNAVKYLQSLHWFCYVDHILLDAAMPDLIRRTNRQYDLIFIQELSGGSAGFQNTLLRFIRQTMLAPEGVLIAPAEYNCGSPEQPSLPLPGSGGKMQMWAAQTTLLADNFQELEKRLQERNENFAETSLSGVMQTLYELRPAEPERRRIPPPPIVRLLNSLREKLPAPLLLLPGLTALSLGFCHLSRRPRRGENFAIFVHGAACMLCLLTILQAALRYRFFLPQMPLAAIFGFIAMALPHRSNLARFLRIPAMLCAAVSGMICLAEWPFGHLAEGTVPAVVPGLLLLFGLLLLAPALRFGCIHKGGESARYLHFAGLLAGAVLALLPVPWAALLTAILLFAA